MCSLQDHTVISPPLITYLNPLLVFSSFFFNDTATTEIYTLSLHDALPISCGSRPHHFPAMPRQAPGCRARSEEHTSELQSQSNLVCRLLLEKKKKKISSSLRISLPRSRRLGRAPHSLLSRIVDNILDWNSP